MFTFIIHESEFERFKYSINSNNLNYAWETINKKFPEAKYIELI